MHNFNPKISICITTFNRCNHLKKTIESIICQDIFIKTNDIEIVISDNSSDDNTTESVLEYVSIYPDKITYKRNQRNIGADLNIEEVLKLANGNLLIAHNDNFPFLAGSISFLCMVYDQIHEEKPILFLSNNFHRTHNEIETFKGHDQFIKNVSYLSAWLSSFTIWKSDFDNLNQFSRNAHTQLVTTDALFRLIDDSRRIISVNTKLFSISDVGKKGGYSLPRVFGRYYIEFLSLLLNDNKISPETFTTEKKRVFFEHIAYYYLNPNHDFASYPFMHDMQHYWDEPYFQAFVDNLIRDNLNIKKANSKNSLSAISTEKASKFDIASDWRNKNNHNETLIGRNFDISKVYVGNYSYGYLNVWTWDNINEKLTIGNFVSIADNVNFLLGGNHKSMTITNYPIGVKFYEEKVNQALTKGPIIVEDDVWIGYGSTIHSGVTIGQGAIIAANSVVVKDVPAYSVVAGNPAKVVKSRFTPENIKKLIQIDYSKIDDDFIINNKNLFSNDFQIEFIDLFPKKNSPINIKN